MTESKAKTSTEPTTDPGQPKINDVRLSDFLEDLLGFGARTFRSIHAIIFTPRDYFEAAKLPDWGGRYSPSIRVYLGLIAVSAIFKYFYAGENGTMTALYTSQFEQMRESIQENDPSVDFNPQALALRTLSLYFFMIPIIGTFMLTIFGWAWRAYGERLSGVVRVRYIFAMAIPSALMGVLLAIFVSIMPNRWIGSVSAFGIGASALLYFITAFRGAYPIDMDPGEKAGRTIALVALIMAITLLSGFIAVIASTAIAFIEIVS